MKKNVLILIALLISVSVKATVGDVLQAETSEGIVMKFKVTSEENMTCAVASYSIDKSTEGTVTIPSSVNGYAVTSISKWSFYQCKSISSIVFPSGLVNIEGSAFSQCECLLRIEVQMPEPITISASTFDTNVRNNAILIVPKGKKSLYMNASWWKSFAIFEMGETVGPRSYTDEQGLIYNLTQTEELTSYCVKGHTEALEDIIIIPEKISGLPVTEIGSSAFSKCTDLKTITIQNGLMEIGSSAFNGCTGLMTVISLIDDPSLLSGNFYPIYKQANLIVPKGTKNAYLAANWSKDFIIYESGEKTHERSVIDSQGIIYSLIQDADTYYYEVSGYTETAAERITIPTDIGEVPVERLGSNAFNNCTALKWIFIPENIEKYYSASGEILAFKGCSFTLALNQKTVGRWNCTSLIGLELGEKVECIEDNAFSGCTELKSLSLPKNISTIGYEAFKGCTKLESVNIEGFAIGKGMFRGCTSLSEVHLNEGIADISESAFTDCIALKDLSLPKNLESIKEYAFQNCTSLESVNLPESLTTIGINAFKNCINLNSIVIPKNVKIPNRSYTSPFEGCTTLQEVTIECESFGYWFKNNTVIKELHFGSLLSDFTQSYIDGCTGIERITVAEDNAKYDSRDNCNAIIETTNNKLIVGCKTTKIPESVVAIDSYAFKGCTNLTEIVIHKGIATFGSDIFSGCTELKDVFSYIKRLDAVSYNNIFPTDVLSSATLHVPYGMATVYKENTYWSFTNIVEMEGTLDEMTFITFAEDATKERCLKYWDYNRDGEISIDEANLVTEIPSYFSDGKISQFDEITYFPNITNIRMSAFKNCSKLTSFIIPSSTSIIGESAFAGCSSLSTITIPGSVTTIGTSAFENCSNLTAIELPEGITAIESNMFKGCSNLGSFTIPSSVTDIGESAFYDCSNLLQIDLPKNLLTIGKLAFFGTGLTKMTIPALVTYIGENALTGLYLYSNMPSPTEGTWKITPTPSEIVLYVPKGSIEAYKAAYGWKDFIYPQDEGGKTEVDWKDGAVIVKLPEAGQLEMAIAELDVASISRLVIQGKMNSVDLTYLHSSKGKISDLESLDLEAVTLVPDEGQYFYYYARTGDVMFSGTHYYFYLSDTEKVVSGTQMNNMYMNKYYKYYGTDLAGAFINMGLKHIVMPKSINRAGSLTFKGCSNLEDVEFSGGLTRIDNSAFLGNSSLTSVNLNEVTSIGSSAFRGCENLTFVRLDNVTSISSDAFNSCKKLISVGKTDKLESIGDYAFSNCVNLRGDNGNLTLSKVDSIPKMAFYECKALEKISLSNRLNYIGPEAFSGCSHLNSVTYPSSLKDVDANSFAGTQWIASLPIIDGIMYMGNIALNYDVAKVDEGSPSTTLSFREGTISIANNFCSSIRTSLTAAKLVLPSTLKRIGDYALKAGDNFIPNYDAIVFPEGLEEIGSGAFDGSGQLSKVNIPKNVKKIGYAFGGCNKLSQITYNAINAEGSGAFAQGVDKVIIGPLVKSLPGEMFSNCSSLVIVKMAGITEPFGIEANTFTNRKNARLYIPVGSKAKYEAADYWKEFKEIVEYYVENGINYSLQDGALAVGQIEVPSENVKIPKCITFDGKDLVVSKIMESAFEDCGYLNSVSIPESVTNIGEAAFKGCTGLSEIYCYNPTPIQLTGIAAKTRSSVFISQFEGVDIENCTLYVPVGSKDNYEKADGWKEFKNIIETNFYIGDVNGDNEVTEADAKAVSDYIIGNTPTGFNKKLADVNEDGKINAADIVLIVDMIINK